MGPGERRRRHRSRPTYRSEAGTRSSRTRLACAVQDSMTLPASRANEAAPAAGLRRTLRPRDLIFIVVGTVIGSGIFLVPGPVLRQTGGDVRLALLVWVVAGVLSLLGALTYAEMGAAKPDAGGLYVYIRDA